MAPTTTRILAEKALGRLPGRECVEWAIEMLEAGRDGHFLARPRELAVLRDHALRELGIAELEPEEAVRRYAVECARALLGDGGEDDDAIDATLSALRRLYGSAGGPAELRTFYDLDFMWSALLQEDAEAIERGSGPLRPSPAEHVRGEARDYLREHGDPPAPPRAGGT